MIAKLVPEDPRTNDRVLLQDIYAQIDLEQFALDPDQPLPQQGSESTADSPVSMMPYPMIHQHPYLHLFPELEIRVRKQEKEDIWYDPYSREYGGFGGDRFKDISGGRNGLIYFIYNPWFEPIFPELYGIRMPYIGASVDSESNYIYDGVGPYWFGNNSVRGVLAETVAELLEEAKLPSTEPAQAPWFRKWRDGRTDLETPEMQKMTIEEFISTPISLDEEKGGFYCLKKYEKCKIIEESRITPLGGVGDPAPPTAHPEDNSPRRTEAAPGAGEIGKNPEG